jgi:ATP-dependent helicase/nuclease subunit B
VQAHYIAVKSRGRVEEWPKGERERKALGEERDAVVQAARRVIVRLWEGEAAPRPLKATVCGRCDARDICRRPAVSPFEEDER